MTTKWHSPSSVLFWVTVCDTFRKSCSVPAKPICREIGASHLKIFPFLMQINAFILEKKKKKGARRAIGPLKRLKSKSFWVHCPLDPRYQEALRQAPGPHASMLTCSAHSIICIGPEFTIIHSIYVKIGPTPKSLEGTVIVVIEKKYLIKCKTVLSVHRPFQLKFSGKLNVPPRE